MSTSGSTTSYVSVSAGAGDSSSSSASINVEQFKIAETIRIRERLAELNSKDLRHYFKGIRKLYDELLAKKEDYAVQVIMHQEIVKEFQQNLQKAREILANTRQNITEEMLESSKKFEELFSDLKEKAPELAEKIEELQQKQKKLAYLKFARNFTILRDEVRRCLRKGIYPHLLDNYRKLLKIPTEYPEYSIDERCRQEYTVKSASLAQFLQLELRSSLATLFSRIHFPFEEPVDHNTLRLPLSQSAQILKCLQLVNFENSAESAPVKDSLLHPNGPIMLILEEFSKRFEYHFYGNRPTNNPSKPEWFFTQLSYWAENNIEYFEQHIQPFIDEAFPENKYAKGRSARDLFLRHLMSLASKKVAEIIRSSAGTAMLEDQHQLGHLIDESVLFEKEMQDSFGYPEEAPFHVVSELCRAEEVLEKWIKLERDTLSAGIDAILADEEAYEPRYQEAADVDPYLVPNFADSFVILMQSMSERYRSIPEQRLQCRFLKLQLVVVDEFRSRIVQIGQHLMRHNLWEKPYPQLMNALWYLTLVLDDWSDSPDYVRLQFFLQQTPTAVGSTSSADSSSYASAVVSLTRGTFDDAAGLYRHVWRQRVRQLCDEFAEEIRRKLGTYANEKWYAMDAPAGRPPAEVTPSLEPFLRRVQELLCWIRANISPDSVLTLYHLTNHELWSAVDECVVARTAFTHHGAAQLLYDCTTAIIPLLHSCYAKVKDSSEFDVFDEKCVQVLNTLRLLALSPPMAILLKDELKHIPEQQLNEKLEQFNVAGMSKARVVEVLEQRCDLIPLEKLIS